MTTRKTGPSKKELEAFKFNEETGEYFDEEFDDFINIIGEFGDEDDLIDDE